MISEELKQQVIANRLRILETVGQAHYYLDALRGSSGIVSPDLLRLKQQLKNSPTQIFDLEEQGRLEIHILKPALPLLAFQQDKTTVLLLLWDRAITFMPSQNTTLAEAAVQAGLIISRVEASATPIPFLIYLVLAFISITKELPTPTHLLLMKQVADPYNRHIPLTQIIVPIREIHEIVARGFAAKTETIPYPAGLWNAARTFVCAGLFAWKLNAPEAAHWGSYPINALPQQDERWNERLQLANLAAMVATPQHYARLPIPPGDGATPQEVWFDFVALAGGSGTPNRLLRPTGLGTFGYSELENNAVLSHLALSPEHGQALFAMAATILAESGDRPPRYIGRILTLDLPLHLLPHLRLWGIASLVVQVEPDGMYISVQDDAGKSMAAAWWKAEAASAYRIPLTFTSASWFLLHTLFACLWKDLKSAAIVLEKPDILASGSSPHASKKKKHTSSAQKQQKVYLPPVRVTTKAHWGSHEDRLFIERSIAGGNTYRLLPKGGLEREQLAWEQWQRTGVKPAVLLTREAAAKRAEEHGRLAPPPGFTYVSPFGRNSEGGLNKGTSQSIITVRAKGLFALRIGLETSSIKLYEDNLEADH